MAFVKTEEFLNKLEENFNASLEFLEDEATFEAVNSSSLRETKLCRALGIELDSNVKLTNEQNLLVRICAVTEDLVYKLHTPFSNVSQIEDDCMYITSYFNLLLTQLQAKSIKSKETNIVEFVKNQLKVNYEHALIIAKAKNSDYAGATDPYKNFRLVEAIDIKVYDGILVRLCDKISRINNLLSADAAVKNESIYDTCLDAINYFTILQSYIQLVLSKRI